MNIALILSGGNGSRLGANLPKQYLQCNGCMVITYCLKTFQNCAAIDAIWVVAQNEYRERIAQELYACGNSNPSKIKGFSEPGQTRQLSIYNGLKDIAHFASPEDVVIIHDAARPLVKEEMIIELIDTLSSHDGAIPVLPMKDTVYFSKDGETISNLLERDKIYAGQAPESFRFGKYLEANERLFPDTIYRINGSTEPAILAGMDIHMIKGDEENYKITTPLDLEKFQRITDCEGKI